MADIFVSYASADRDIARQLAESLMQRGYSVWWDRTIPPGRVFDEVIQEALDAAACVIVLWSKTSVASNWVKAESSDALTHNRLVPALIDKVSPPIEFRRIQAADLTEWHGESDNTEYLNLLASVTRLIESRSTKTTASSAQPHPAATIAASNSRASAANNRVTQMIVGAVLVAVVLSVALIKLRGSKSDPIAAANVAAGTASLPAVNAPSSTTSSAASITHAVGASSASISKAVAGRINLLSPDNGGQLLVAATDRWSMLNDGKEETYAWVEDGIGIYGFSGGKAATFDTFAVLIPKTDDNNVKDFELFAGNDSLSGHFDLIGKFTTQNVRMMQQPYQEFHFAPVTAKYLKFHTLGNQVGRNNAVMAYEFQLFGSLP